MFGVPVCEQLLLSCAEFHEVGSCPPPMRFECPTRPRNAALFAVQLLQWSLSARPADVEPVSTSCCSGFVGTCSPRSSRSVVWLRLFTPASSCSCARLFAMITSFELRHGPLPTREIASTVEVLRYARHVFAPSEGSIAPAS